MSVRSTLADSPDDVFVSRQSGAARMEICVDTWDAMDRDGTLPKAVWIRGCKRWYWPTVVETFVPGESEDDDPYLKGVNHAKGKARRSS